MECIADILAVFDERDDYADGGDDTDDGKNEYKEQKENVTQTNQPVNTKATDQGKQENDEVDQIGSDDVLVGLLVVLQLAWCFLKVLRIVDGALYAIDGGTDHVCYGANGTKHEGKRYFDRFGDLVFRIAIGGHVVQGLFNGVDCLVVKIYVQGEDGSKADEGHDQYQNGTDDGLDQSQLLTGKGFCKGFASHKKFLLEMFYWYVYILAPNFGKVKGIFTYFSKIRQKPL